MKSSARGRRNGASEWDNNQIRRLLVNVLCCLSEASKLFSINSLRLSHHGGPWFLRHTIPSIMSHSSTLFISASLRNYCEHIIPRYFAAPLSFTLWQFSSFKIIAFETFHTPSPLNEMLGWRRGVMGKLSQRAVEANGGRHIYNYLSLLWKLMIIFKISETEEISPLCRRANLESIEKDCFSM